MFSMIHEPFTVESLVKKSPIASPVEAGSLNIVKPRSLHFQITKAPSLAKHRKATKCLIAMLDKSPTVKSGGITAEISRDRDKGRP